MIATALAALRLEADMLNAGGPLKPRWDRAAPHHDLILSELTLNLGESDLILASKIAIGRCCVGSPTECVL